MTLTIFLVGLPAMLLCLVMQTAVTFWCVRHYVRQSTPHATSGLWRGRRPLAVAMLVMMVGNLFQIALCMIKSQHDSILRGAELRA